jgi:hypothetical protein
VQASRLSLDSALGTSVAWRLTRRSHIRSISKPCGFRSPRSPRPRRSPNAPWSHPFPQRRPGSALKRRDRSALSATTRTWSLFTDSSWKPCADGSANAVLRAAAKTHSRQRCARRHLLRSPVLNRRRGWPPARLSPSTASSRTTTTSAFPPVRPPMRWRRTWRPRPTTPSIYRGALNALHEQSMRYIIPLPRGLHDWIIRTPSAVWSRRFRMSDNS